MLFIFDWDGTLSDSTAKITGAMQSAMDDLGHPVLATEQVKSIIGLGLPEAVRTLIPGIDEPGIQAMRSRYVYHFEEVDPTPPPLYPTALETLEGLLNRGHQIAIATGKSRRGLNKVLAELELTDLFHASRCADETASKPHPRMLQELLQEFQVPAADAVMIGDTAFDLEMAQNAAMRSVAVDYGAHPLDRLMPYKPIMCISKMRELLDFPCS
ncbi:MAG: HAD-IA family hydrolase [Candidatus Pelagadaptatus aseana]|uniref:HAD family hydrolase n=1 Tax=Candidatus Pelagadaptatus aseana TaxID=3120508 RepID=UPI0039B26539